MIEDSSSARKAIRPEGGPPTAARLYAKETVKNNPIQNNIDHEGHEGLAAIIKSSCSSCPSW
nr:hypothetical protein [Methylomarinum sp. Ch1-1]MDP4521351.1 hypothetical protein [Methylomarinum sp. Ch1-1]